MFIKLYIHAQSGPVIEVIVATLVLPSGGQLYFLRKYMITHGLGDVCEYLCCDVCVDCAFLVLPVILSSRSIFRSSLIFCIYILPNILVLSSPVFVMFLLLVQWEKYKFGICTHINIYLPSTCPLHSNSRCEKREAHINWSMVTCKMVAPVSGTTLRNTGLCRRTLGSERHRYAFA